MFEGVVSRNINKKLSDTQSLVLKTLRLNPFENTAGKGENAGTQHFLPFPTVFSTPYTFRNLNRI